MRSLRLIPILSSLAATSPLKSTDIPNTFDYIIAGGGAGGLVVANRLSETNASVLIIEAGGPGYDNPNVTALDGYGRALNTAVDWSYPTVPQKDGSVHAMHAGKILGGSTAINGVLASLISLAEPH